MSRCCLEDTSRADLRSQQCWHGTVVSDPGLEESLVGCVAIPVWYWAI